MQKQSLFGALVLLSTPLWMGADGCDGPLIARDCEFGGRTYEAGQKFMDDCNWCTCERDGDVSCTLVGCEGDGSDDACEMAGVLHEVGEVWQDDCNTCSCEQDGVWSCTAIACEPSDGCTFGEASFVDGDELICPDGCNACACTGHGDGSFGWASTDVACQPLPAVEPCTTDDPENVTVDALYLDGDALALRVSPHDGCEPRDFRLCWDGGGLLESLSPQLNLWVEHLWNGAQCDELYELDLVFDVSALPRDNGGIVLLNVGDDQLRYTR